jgi:hypothetical protein
VFEKYAKVLLNLGLGFTFLKTAISQIGTTNFPDEGLCPQYKEVVDAP